MISALRQVSNETGIRSTDLIEGKTSNGEPKFSVICPKCGRKRSAMMAFFTECPGPYDEHENKSLGGCNSDYYIRPDIKKQIAERKENRFAKLKEWIKQKKGGEDMGFLSRKKVVETKKDGSKVTIKSQILEAHKKGVEFEVIAKQVDRSRAYVKSTISKASKKK